MWDCLESEREGKRGGHRWMQYGALMLLLLQVLVLSFPSVHSLLVIKENSSDLWNEWK